VGPAPAALASAQPLHLELQVATRSTRLLRALAAMLLAYLIFHGTLTVQQLRVPPVLVVVAVQALIIGTTRMLLGHKGFYKWASADATLAEPLPARFRSLDLMGLVPGLKDALANVSSALEVANSVMDGVAVFIVSCALLTAAS